MKPGATTTQYIITNREGQPCPHHVSPDSKVVELGSKYQSRRGKLAALRRNDIANSIKKNVVIGKKIGFRKLNVGKA